MDAKQQTQKGICDIISKGPIFLHCGGAEVRQCWPQWPQNIGVVSVENSLCSIILMAVSNCIIPEQQVALAEGVAALTALPHWPRGSGQGSRVRALSGRRLGSWPMGRAGQRWGAAVVRGMIYRCAGWREC